MLDSINRVVEKGGISLYQKAAAEGDVSAKFNLGVCYKTGKGVKKDGEKAFKWFQEAASQGDAESQVHLGNCYREGVGVRKDNNEAVKWFHKAAIQGNSVGQTNLGICYVKGEGVKKDNKEAITWFRRAAAQGDSGGQFNVGECYQSGVGVGKNLKEAISWFLKAAVQDDSDAQDRLGYCYHRGQGVTRNYKESAEWFRKAAIKGDSNAQYNLGICYLNGEGVKKNNEEAAKWFQKAAKQEHSTALSVLDGLSHKSALPILVPLKGVRKIISKKRKSVETTTSFSLTKFKADRKPSDSTSPKKMSSSSSKRKVDSFDSDSSDDDIPLTDWVRKPKRLPSIPMTTKNDSVSKPMEVSPKIGDTLSSAASSLPISSTISSATKQGKDFFLKEAMTSIPSSSTPLAPNRSTIAQPSNPMTLSKNDKSKTIVTKEKLLSPALKPTQTNLSSEQKTESSQTFSESSTKKVKQSLQLQKSTSVSLPVSPRRTTTRVGKSRQLTIVDKEFVPIIEPEKLTYASVRFFKPELKQKPKPVSPPVTAPQDRKQVEPKRVEKQERLTEEAKRQIGRWGENCVYQKLKQHYENKYHGKADEVADGFILEGVDDDNNKVKLEVRWYNKVAESYNHIDFMVIKNKNGETKERYIEVKATTSDEVHKATFPASEWQAILTYKEKYSIYRVFNAGQSEKVRIEKIKNPLEKIVKGELGVESMRLEI